MLSMNTSDLYVVFVSNGIECFFVLHQFWELDMNWCSKSSSKICWAWGNITEMLIMGEFQILFNMSGSSAKSIENFLDTSSWLHRDNSQLIFFVDPDQESLSIIMENSSSWWPVSVKVACFQESITLPIWYKNKLLILIITFNIGYTYLKRKWSSMSCWETAASIPSSG